MNGQTVVQFPTTEQQDERDLAAALAKDSYEDLITAIAALIYKARGIYVGGLLVPWGMIGKMRQEVYRVEARQTVEEFGGER